MNLPFSDFQVDLGKGLNLSKVHRNILKFHEDITCLCLLYFGQWLLSPSLSRDVVPREFIANISKYIKIII
jgi:hypothetical protein